MNDMKKQIGEISNKDDFLRFLNALIEDFRKNPEEWQNLTIDLYLEAMLSWIEDYSSSKWNDIDWEHISYSTMAKILYMGKLYE